MSESHTPPRIPAQRLVVIMPNWLGDGVMATPFLRALRHLYPNAHIAALARPLVAPVLNGLPFINEIKIHEKGHDSKLARWLKSQQFDLGILLPNSFRSAWLLFRARIPRRLGYARDRRSVLLTDRLTPIKRTGIQRALDDLKAAAIRKISFEIASPTERPRIGSPFQPLPTIEYYLELANYLRADSPTPSSPPDPSTYAGFSRHMELAITPEEQAEADSALRQICNQQSKIDNYLLVVPGANFGASKCWSPDRFAAVADACITRYQTHILLAGSPAELPIIDAIIAASEHPNRILPLPRLNNNAGISLGALKPLVRRARLMLCNDTGPRHFAAAFNTPAITLFGPTDPIWAETFHPREKTLSHPVPCGPCQLKTCPIDHRCMRGITVESVMAAIDALWHNAPVITLTDPR